jgi:hypothetical protein
MDQTVIEITHSDRSMLFSLRYADNGHYQPACVMFEGKSMNLCFMDNYGCVQFEVIARGIVSSFADGTMISHNWLNRDYITYVGYTILSVGRGPHGNHFEPYNAMGIKVAETIGCSVSLI